MKTSISEDSWMGQLIRRYERIPLEKLDRANEIICDALDKINQLTHIIFLGEFGLSAGRQPLLL